ncbi:glycosyl transferase [Bacillus sp. Cr_A10]|uniref:glycosyl transferase n=1 Tax=Bacillus sp. Cr_A10 TaxID=3033993 RepID=UPI0023DC8151|nr:glycosyl transferase [Bacillus sp. Cr_A10]MDF2066653.1 glycosyl transferase [Bacillus sp. Cr_A10]
MKKQVWYFILGLIVIILSTPLGYFSINVVYSNENLTGEYVSILNGFIHSFMLIGTLIFSVGLLNILRDKY